MKHLLKFQKFFEEIDLEVKITDEPSVRMSKEKYKTFKKQLAEYKTKKPLIDKAYLMAETEEDLNIKVKEIIGKTDSLPKEDRNPFLVEYLNVANLKRKIDRLQKDIATDKVKKDDFSQELNLSSESSVKSMVDKKLKDVGERIKTNTSSIASLTKEVAESQRKLLQKMTKLQKEMTDYIKKISTQSQK